MNNLQFSVENPGIAILGSEYCSGYIDSLGKWNTGFYCPSSDETVNVFCCGSSIHKYCCTKKDQVIQEEMEGLTVLIGVLVGTSTALLFLTIVFCMCCPLCPKYKMKKPEKYTGSVYRLPHHYSSDSRVTNTYIIGNGAGSSPTPIAPSLTGQDTGRPCQQIVQLYSQGMSHSHTLPHNLSHHHSFPVRDEGTGLHENDIIYGTLGRQPREQPPAYHILPRASYLLIPQDTPYLLSETMIEGDTVSESKAKVNMMDMDNEEKAFQSTKF